MRFSICDILALCSLLAVGNAAPKFACKRHRVGSDCPNSEGYSLGVPDRPGVRPITIAPDGGAAIPVAIIGQGTYDIFLVARPGFFFSNESIPGFPREWDCGSTSRLERVTWFPAESPSPVISSWTTVLPVAFTKQELSHRFLLILGQCANLTAITLPGSLCLFQDGHQNRRRGG